MKCKPRNAFWAGILFHMGAMMAIQDWMGLEAYLEHVNNGWVDLHWTVGGVIVLISLAMIVIIEVKYEQRSTTIKQLDKKLEEAGL